MVDFAKLGALAAEKGVDMTQAVSGGGDYTPPAEGPCRLRLVSYIELGKHSKKFKGVDKVTPRVALTFELSGTKHAPVDGVPHRITIEENLSLNEKSNFFKLFQRMNYKGTAKHMAQLLGEPFKGVVVHDKWKGNDGKDRISAELRGPDGYTIQPPRIEDDEEESGYRTMTVDPAISPIRCFIWDLAEKDQWDSLFIDGEYPARTNDKGEVTHPAKSKNQFQNKIKTAVNFKGSPIHTLLTAGGVEIDIPAVDNDDERPDRDEAPATPAANNTPTPTGAAADDALNGIV